MFRPKILIRAKNGGASLPGWNASLHLTQFEGPLPSMSQAAEGWVEVDRITELKRWDSGKTRQRWIKVQATSLPTPGTYVMRLQFERDDPAAGGLCAGRPIATFDVAEYFRVEPMPSVLTLGLVVATGLTALATLVLAIAR